MKKKVIQFILLIGILLILCSIFHILINKYKTEQAIINSLLHQYDLLDISRKNNIHKVGKFQRYSTITKAVKEAEEEDIIIVFSGEYTESVHAANKTLYIIGVDRNSCVISHPNGNYYSPPLEQGSGMLANITISASDEEIHPDAIAKAYSLHVDFDISKNSSLQIIDVTFINESYQTVGIGLRENFTLFFQNCSFECKSDYNAFYCHDDPIYKGSKNQRLIVENCSFLNNGINSSTIKMQSQEVPDSEILCKWNNNTVVNTAKGPCFSVYFWNEKIISDFGWHGMSFWKNSNKSSGNNISEINEF